MKVKRSNDCNCFEPRRTWHVYFLYITLPLIGFFLGIIYQQLNIKNTDRIAVPSTQIPPRITSTPIAAYLSSLTPDQGSIGTKVTLSGTGFSLTENYIVFGSAYLGPFASNDGKTLPFTVPDKATGGCNRPFNKSQIHCLAIILQTTNPGNTYDISVLTAEGESNKLPFQVTY
jgi:hypothetical protein